MLTILRSVGAAGCPRCGRQVAPEDLEDVPLGELRLIDPHLEGYVRHAAGGQVAVCQDCGDQLDALAGELEAYRRRLLRTWPTPRAHRAAPREDQCLSQPFEALRDTALPLVLGSAIWHARQGATAYLIISANGEWSIKAVPSGEACTSREEHGHVAVPIPLAPGADALADEDLVGLSIEAVYHHCVGTKAEAAALERELAARFYRALYGQEEDGREEVPE